MLFIDDVMHMLDMQAMYILYCVHDGFAVLCEYGVVRMLDMQCCVHMVLCTYVVVYMYM